MLYICANIALFIWVTWLGIDIKLNKLKLTIGKFDVLYIFTNLILQKYCPETGIMSYLIFFKNRHAVSVAATSGHPYNQLALLEAGRGNRLASVFLYIRALCVAAPFPGAPSNLMQTMSKVLSNR